MHPIPSPETFSAWKPGVFSLVIFTAAVFALAAALLWISAWLGEKRGVRGNRDKLIPYESGVIPTGSARLHYPIPFFLVAIFFLIFDVEGAFIFTWATAWEPLGWAGWLRIGFFIVVLLAGLAYIWKKEGLEWGPRSTRKSNRG